MQLTIIESFGAVVSLIIVAASIATVSLIVALVFLILDLRKADIQDYDADENYGLKEKGNGN